ncbi:MAG: tyrosine--tRNA ligase [Deltaproteobacteria bacterium]|nr:tyrosine--tRNA ligase [Deltaproteobacteria bacterium]MBM4318166.1 tyrosine--tRNA ligase [Deltaproteobacteria bacterium]
MITAQEQLAELKRGTSEILSEKDLLTKLERAVKTNKPLVIKAGFDPTAPDIHLGHTVLMQKMAQFQRLGHQVIFLIGDFTAMVGDPSGKSKTRPQLSPAEIIANVETYKKQVYKILDPQKTIIRFNSEWLNAFKATDFIRLASHANVARMLEREDFNRRYKEGQSISLHEFIYPLLQAYDSVALKADVELGGTDQKFNLLMGRELMRDHQLEPQVCLMMPLLEGLDGVQKMSKSLNNYVGVDESPNEIYGKMMSLPDSLLRRYYDLLSARPLQEIEAMFGSMAKGELNPKWVKSDLAVEIVTRYHCEEAAQGARQNFENIFAKKEIPDDIPEVSYPDSEEVWIPKLLVTLKFVATTSEGKRLLAQGGVKIDEAPVKEERLFKMAGKTITLQCGKRKFAKVKF